MDIININQSKDRLQKAAEKYLPILKIEEKEYSIDSEKNKDYLKQIRECIEYLAAYSFGAAGPPKNLLQRLVLEKALDFLCNEVEKQGDFFTLRTPENSKMSSSYFDLL